MKGSEEQEPNVSSVLPKPHPLPSYSALLTTQKRSPESKNGAGACGRSRGDHGRQGAYGTHCPQPRPRTERRLSRA